MNGRVALVTGAGSGMGKASVRVFAREGARVVAGDISGAEEQVAAEVDGDGLTRLSGQKSSGFVFSP